MSSSWHNLALNPEAIANLYNYVPYLENVELFSLLMNRDGPQISASLKLSRYPDKPPKRWLPEFNTVQVHLNFIDISNFMARGLYTEMKVDVRIKRDSNTGLKVHFKGLDNNMDVSFDSGFFHIDRITPYILESRPCSI